MCSSDLLTGIAPTINERDGVSINRVGPCRRLDGLHDANSSNKVLPELSTPGMAFQDILRGVQAILDRAVTEVTEKATVVT